jgi:hypothetical protein
MSDTVKPLGRIRITAEKLAELLLLPEGNRIIRLREHPVLVNGPSDLEILVTGPGLPLCADGMPVEEVRPYYRKEFPTNQVLFVEYDWFGKVKEPC